MCVCVCAQGARRAEGTPDRRDNDETTLQTQDRAHTRTVLTVDRLTPMTEGSGTGREASRAWSNGPQADARSPRVEVVQAQRVGCCCCNGGGFFAMDFVALWLVQHTHTCPHTTIAHKNAVLTIEAPRTRARSHRCVRDELNLESRHHCAH